MGVFFGAGALVPCGYTTLRTVSPTLYEGFLNFAEAKYGATFGLPAANWAALLPAGVAAALPAITGEMKCYTAVCGPAVRTLYPSFLDDDATAYGGNGVPGWAVQNQYKYVESFAATPADGTLQKTSVVGNGHAFPGAPDWQPPLTGRKGWVVMDEIITLTPDNFSFP